jgi:hypothetical protein
MVFVVYKLVRTRLASTPLLVSGLQTRKSRAVRSAYERGRGKSPKVDSYLTESYAKDDETQ